VKRSGQKRARNGREERQKQKWKRNRREAESEEREKQKNGKAAVEEVVLKNSPEYFCS
jgi:hypothetical protein